MAKDTRDQRNTIQLISMRMNNVRMNGHVCYDELFWNNTQWLEVGDMMMAAFMQLVDLYWQYQRYPYVAFTFTTFLHGCIRDTTINILKI